MIIKSYEIKKNISNLNKHNLYLLYGENFGLKKDIKETIKANVKENGGNIEMFSLYENEILENKDNFYSLIYSGSLFSNKKIITIFEATDKIIKEMNNINDKYNENTFIISHKGDILFDKFTNIIKFEKYKNFTRIAA